MTFRAYQALLVAAFCALLCIPGLTMLIRPEVPKLYGVKPVSFPHFKSWEKWPTDFEEYFAANLGHKRRLIQLNNLVGYRVIGDLQNDSVLVGTHDWLYLKQNFGWESMRSEEPLSTRDAATWRRDLQGAQSFLAKHQVAFLWVIVPSKETIYPEFLPKSAPRARAISRLDEMLGVFASTGVDYLELRTPLLEGRKHAQLYDSIDSHWNGNGVRIGADLMMKRVTTLLNRPDSYADLDSSLKPRPSWADLPLLVSLDDVIGQPSVELVPNRPRARRLEPPESVKEPTRKQQNRMVFEVDDASLPTALILRDSFSEGCMPTLTEKFRRSVWIWTHEIDLRLVPQEQPDIVIVEMTERFMSDTPPKLMLPRASR